MTEEEVDLKKIAKLRDILEERTRRLEAELEGLRVILKFVNDLLLKKSFKRLEVPKGEVPELRPTPTPPKPPTFQLKTVTGELLADVYREENALRIVPAADKSFNINTPPFMTFLVDRVLRKMVERDQEAVRKGEILPEAAISYDIRREGDIIREIVVSNVTPSRERELRSAIRWTLEKMYEKMKAT